MADVSAVNAEVDLVAVDERLRAGLSPLPALYPRSARLADWDQAARDGVPAAMALVGLCYIDGVAVARDPERAADWLRSAAQRGVPAAQALLGEVLRGGEGIPADDHEAARWFRAAADADYPPGLLGLADFYQVGRGGLEQDPAQAAELIHRAARHECGTAFRDAGIIADVGTGCEPDPAEADRWYARAWDFFRPHAEAGDSRAQFCLGGMLAGGSGADYDLTEARRWLTRSVKGGEGDVARVYLGSLLLLGPEEGRDPEAALSLFQAAALAGYAEAHYHLGECHRLGHGAPRDPAEAVACFRRGVQQGSRDCEYALGHCLQAGVGVECDLTEAAAHFRRAAGRGSVAALDLAYLLADGRGVPADRAEALLLARRMALAGVDWARLYLGDLLMADPATAAEAGAWYDLAARGLALRVRRGVPSCQGLLGEIHRHGRDVPVDLEQARRWLTPAAEAGEEFARISLGQLLLDHPEGPDDPAGGLAWLRRAAEQGSPDAASELGSRLVAGQGAAADPAAAARWFRQGADRGSATAQVSLGTLHREGQGVPPDDAEAVRWFSRAAAQCQPDGQMCLALCHSEGRGVPASGRLAAHWYAEAEARGHLQARFLLGALLHEGRPDLPADRERGARLVRAAADAGLPEAQYWYGLFLSQQGDHAAARPWLEAASEGGLEAAQGALAGLPRLGGWGWVRRLFGG